MLKKTASQLRIAYEAALNRVKKGERATKGAESSDEKILVVEGEADQADSRRRPHCSAQLANAEQDEVQSLQIYVSENFGAPVTRTCPGSLEPPFFLEHA